MWVGPSSLHSSVFWRTSGLTLTLSFSHPRKEQSYVQKHWEDVRVGDFIQMHCNEIVPADLLLLFSSDPSGVCHLETANLDGETNLKQRRVVKGFSQQVGLVLASARVRPEGRSSQPHRKTELSLVGSGGSGGCLLSQPLGCKTPP